MTLRIRTAATMAVIDHASHAGSSNVVIKKSAIGQRAPRLESQTNRGFPGRKPTS